MTMKLDNDYRWHDDRYGRSVCALVSDDQIVNHFVDALRLVVVTYDRRTTIETERTEDLPRSLS